MADFVPQASTFVPYTPVAPSFQAAGTRAVATNGTASPAWPTHQADDIALLIVESQDEAITLSTASGFVEVTNSPQLSAAATRLAVFWARATSSAMAAPVVTAVTDHLNAQIVTFRNISTGVVPWNITSGGQDNTSDTSLSIPTMTTTKDNCLIVYIATNDTDIGTARYSSEANASLKNLTERVDQATTSGGGGSISVWTGNKAIAGATGTFTATAADAAKKAFLQIALNISESSVLPYKYCTFFLTADSTVSFVDKDGNTSDVVPMKAGYQPVLVKRITELSTGNLYIMKHHQLN